MCSVWSSIGKCSYGYSALSCYFLISIYTIFLWNLNLFIHHAVGYCSYNGKKFDPEPGRCRRTDGKKWRCSKDAHSDSKYCERHMHRGRNRSRKPVESQSTSQSLLTAKSNIPTSCTSNNGSFVGNGSGSFQNTPLYSVSSQGLSFNNSAKKLHMEHTTHAIDNKDFRYFHLA